MTRIKISLFLVLLLHSCTSKHNITLEFEVAIPQLALAANQGQSALDIHADEPGLSSVSSIKFDLEDDCCEREGSSIELDKAGIHTFGTVQLISSYHLPPIYDENAFFEIKK